MLCAPYHHRGWALKTGTVSRMGPRTGTVLPAGNAPTREGKGRKGKFSNYSTAHVLPAMAQLLFVSVHGTWAQSTLNDLLVRFLLLTAWPPHRSLLSSWNFGLVSWLAVSARVQLMYLWTQDHVNQRAQSSFRWAAEVKHQQIWGEKKLPECIRALVAFYILVNILQSFLQKICKEWVSITCFVLV